MWDVISKVWLKEEGRGVLQDLFPAIGQLELAYFFLRDVSLTLMYMTSLMVLVILCAFLPTMEKLSTLM